VFGLGEDARSDAVRLIAGLRHVVGELGEPQREATRPFAPPPPWGPLEMAPRSAFFASQEAVPIEDAEGRIAAESLAAYPPGIPNVLPGERIEPETLAFIHDVLAEGGKLRGAVDRSLRTIRVVVEQP
jgi:lysine decarboxylase